MKKNIHTRSQFQNNSFAVHVLYTHAKERAHPFAHASCHFNGYMPLDLASYYVHKYGIHSTYDRNHLKGLPVSWHKTRAIFGEAASKRMGGCGVSSGVNGIRKTIWIKTENKPYYNNHNNNNNNNKSASECRW